MRKIQSGPLAYYVFENLSSLPWLRHLVAARQGPDGSDWTLSFNDEFSQVKTAQSLRLIEAELGAGPLAIVGQVHGDKALVLEPDDDYAPKSAGEMREGFDAIVSGPGRSMMVRLADCQGIILADKETRRVAAVHSGWRGSAQNIAGKTVRLLISLGSRPESLLAAVGPSLGPCCAEMRNYKTELPEELWPFASQKPLHFDFWAATRHQLEEAGVAPDKIEIAGLCTKCHPDFYSYRRGDKGRFGVAAGALK
ncbi:MAG: polyphenol oxidase family protein [Deltaproteobacteria bacterium]|jgi:YfiH family protein|nr:polyphenol oxidase family protein [Deltaproteobacteria bacterium]